MYCKKCKFHSFDHVSTCPKCGADWEETRKALYLNWITASGTNWLAPATSAPQAAPAPSPFVSEATGSDSFDSMSDASDGYYATTPHMELSPPNPRDADIDVSLFPELDFTMTESKPETSDKIPSRMRSAPAPKPDEEIFLDAMPVEEMVELDFSASFDAPAASKTPAPSSSKREDLFIPELEEMLAPLADDNRPGPAPSKKPAYSEETDILLDFGSGSSQKSAGKDDDDLSFLSLDDTKKSS